jgi:hypothetical protein
VKSKAIGFGDAALWSELAIGIPEVNEEEALERIIECFRQS